MVKKKKKKLNIKRTLVFLLFLYIIFYGIYICIKQPIKHIEITGNKLVKDSEIIKSAKLKDYPSIFKYSSNTIENRIESIDLISKAKVTKWLGFTLKIEVMENKILFYFKNTDKIVLSDGKIIENKYDLTGIPIFKNDIEEDIFKDFINKFSSVNENIIYEMSDIEYYPNYNEAGEIIESDRFKITMNDGNTVILDTKSCNKLNKYNDIFASLSDKKGTLYLNDNSVFISY